MDSLWNLVSRAHLDVVAALAQGGGTPDSRGRDRKVVILQPMKAKLGEIGGEKSPRNTGLWSWRIRGVLPEITLLLVCPNFHFFLHVSRAALALDSSLPHPDPMQISDLCSPERTFLAWLRTSLAFASIGIAVTQLFRLNTTISEREGFTPANPDNTYHLRQVGKPLGATFLGIAILVLLVGGRRYFESQVCHQKWLGNGGAMLYPC